MYTQDIVYMYYVWRPQEKALAYLAGGVFPVHQIYSFFIVIETC